VAALSRELAAARARLARAAEDGRAGADALRARLAQQVVATPPAPPVVRAASPRPRVWARGRV
jgi:hypothetical protein